MLHDILHYTPRPVFLDGLSVIGGGEGGRHDKSDTAGTKIIIKQSSTFVLCVNMSPSTLFEEVSLNQHREPRPFLSYLQGGVFYGAY